MGLAVRHSATMRPTPVGVQPGVCTLRSFPLLHPRNSPFRHSAMSLRRSLLAVLPIIVLPAVVAAQARTDTPQRVVTQSTAARASGVMRIDGRLDEEAWAQAPVTESFTQIDPEEGKPA